MQRENSQSRRRSRRRNILLAALVELSHLEARLAVLESQAGPEMTPEARAELGRLASDLYDIEEAACVELLVNTSQSWQRHAR